MVYKAIKGLSCEPYKLSVSAGMEFDNKKEKLSKELIDRAIYEKKIIPVEPNQKVKQKSKTETLRPMKKY